MINNFEIVTVNYNTPDLIDRLIKSVRNIEGNYLIRIIDGSDKEPFKSDIIDVCEKYDDVILEQQGWNIHHGRGMDLGILTSKMDWCLFIDSDNYIQQPIIEMLFNSINNNKKIVGEYCHVNSNGIGVSRYYSIDFSIKYYHPSLLLFNRGYYQTLKEIGVGFIHHGAPCIQIMYYLHKNNLTDLVAADVFEDNNILDSEIGKYVNRISRGTVNRFGYNL